MRKLSGFSKEGVSLLGIAEAAESIGFKTKGVQLSLQQLITEAQLPAVVHWRQNHFVIVAPNSNQKKIRVADPAKGFLTYTGKEFCKAWITNKNESGESTGVALLLEPTVYFHQQDDSAGNNLSIGWANLINYVTPYGQHVLQVVLALLLGSHVTKDNLYAVLSRKPVMKVSHLLWENQAAIQRYRITVTVPLRSTTRPS